MLSSEIREKLPAEAEGEEIEEHLVLSRGLDSMIGESLLLRVGEGWMLLTRESVLDEFRLVGRAAKEGLSLEKEGLDDYLLFEGEGDAPLKMRVDYFDQQKLSELLRGTSAEPVSEEVRGGGVDVVRGIGPEASLERVAAGEFVPEGRGEKATEAATATDRGSFGEGGGGDVLGAWPSSKESGAQSASLLGGSLSVEATEQGEARERGEERGATSAPEIAAGVGERSPARAAGPAQVQGRGAVVSALQGGAPKRREGSLVGKEGMFGDLFWATALLAEEAASPGRAQGRVGEGMGGDASLVGVEERKVEKSKRGEKSAEEALSAAPAFAAKEPLSLEVDEGASESTQRERPALALGQASPGGDRLQARGAAPALRHLPLFHDFCKEATSGVLLPERWKVEPLGEGLLLRRWWFFPGGVICFVVGVLWMLWEGVSFLGMLGLLLAVVGIFWFFAETQLLLSRDELVIRWGWHFWLMSERLAPGQVEQVFLEETEGREGRSVFRLALLTQDGEAMTVTNSLSSQEEAQQLQECLEQYFYVAENESKEKSR